MRALCLLALLMLGCQMPSEQAAQLDQEIELLRQRIEECETAVLAIRNEKKRRVQLQRQISQIEAEIARLKRR